MAEFRFDTPRLGTLRAPDLGNTPRSAHMPETQRYENWFDITSPQGKAVQPPSGMSPTQSKQGAAAEEAFSKWLTSTESASCTPLTDRSNCNRPASGQVTPVRMSELSSTPTVQHDKPTSLSGSPLLIRTLEAALTSRNLRHLGASVLRSSQLSEHESASEDDADGTTITATPPFTPMTHPISVTESMGDSYRSTPNTNMSISVCSLSQTLSGLRFKDAEDLQPESPGMATPLMIPAAAFASDGQTCLKPHSFNTMLSPISPVDCILDLMVESPELNPIQPHAYQLDQLDNPVQRRQEVISFPQQTEEYAEQEDAGYSSEEIDPVEIFATPSARAQAASYGCTPIDRVIDMMISPMSQK